MMVSYFGYELEVPDKLINEYTDQLRWLSDGQPHEEVDDLRNALFDLMLLIKAAPDMLEETYYRKDFIKSLAIKEALSNIKLLHND